MSLSRNRYPLSETCCSPARPLQSLNCISKPYQMLAVQFKQVFELLQHQQGKVRWLPALRKVPQYFALIGNVLLGFAHLAFNRL